MGWAAQQESESQQTRWVMISISVKALNRSGGEKQVDFSTTLTEGLEWFINSPDNERSGRKTEIQQGDCEVNMITNAIGRPAWGVAKETEAIHLIFLLEWNSTKTEEERTDKVKRSGRNFFHTEKATKEDRATPEARRGELQGPSETRGGKDPPREMTRDIPVGRS